MSSQKPEAPTELIDYVHDKTGNSKTGGRPHFLQELAKLHPQVIDELLNLLEDHWLKGRNLRNLARKYKTSYYTLRRLVQDLEPFKDKIVDHLKLSPQRKQFYNKETDSSDYESVQIYIQRAHREELRTYKKKLETAKKCWKFLGHKDPKNWTADDVLSFIRSLPDGSQFAYLIAVRQIAPQIADEHSTDYVSTIRAKQKIKRRKKDIFAAEVKMILKALEHPSLRLERIIFKLHVSTGAREGSRDTKSGLTGISFDKFKKDFSKVDIYESKVRQGILWQNCPVDLMFFDLPHEIRELWKDRGKPTTAKLVEGGYHELRQIYRQIRLTVKDYYNGKIEPSLFQELSDLKPHDADKIHVNLLWEAEVPLEVVCGQVIGHGMGLGLVGRGWVSADVIREYYLSLTERSARFKKLRDQITAYAGQFNVGAPQNA